MPLEPFGGILREVLCLLLYQKFVDIIDVHLDHFLTVKLDRTCTDGHWIQSRATSGQEHTLWELYKALLLTVDS